MAIGDTGSEAGDNGEEGLSALSVGECKVSAASGARARMGGDWRPGGGVQVGVRSALSLSMVTDDEEVVHGGGDVNTGAGRGRDDLVLTVSKNERP
jgi:hypothetical protein